MNEVVEISMWVSGIALFISIAFMIKDSITYSKKKVYKEDKVMSAKCDVCGKEVDNVTIHSFVNGGGHIAICPECYEECRQPKKPINVIKPDQSVTFENDKKDQLKAIIGIQKELHELNKTLKHIAGRIR